MNTQLQALHSGSNIVSFDCGVNVLGKSRTRGVVVAFLNDKGGVGKSTSCLSLGAYAARLGLACTIIDTDSSNSCINWGRKAEALSDKVPHLIARSGKAMGAEIERQRKINDLVLIDGMSSFLSDERASVIGTIICNADMVLIPTKPNHMDLEKVTRFCPLLHKRRQETGGKPEVFIYGYMISSNAQEWKDFIGSAQMAPFPVMSSYIPHSVIVPRLTAKGKAGVDATSKRTGYIGNHFTDWATEVLQHCRKLIDKREAKEA